MSKIIQTMAISNSMESGFDTANRTASDSDGWFVSYADILLLLLTFFVLLFAFSRIEGLGASEEGAESSEDTLSGIAADFEAKPAYSDIESSSENQFMLAAVEPIEPVAHFMAVASIDGTSIVSNSSTNDDEFEVVHQETLTEGVQEGSQLDSTDIEQEQLDLAATEDELSQPASDTQVDYQERQRVAPEERMYETLAEAEEVPASQIPLDQAPNLIAKAHTVALTVDEQLAKLSAGLTSGEVELSSGYQSINIELNNKVLFPLGKANLLDEGRPFLNEIAAIMIGNDYFASIEGHTDDSPIATTQFPSNWELSSTRATTVARYLIEQGVEATRLRAIGYADTKPKVDNTTLDGRARNRRVSITFHYDSDAPLS